MSRSEKFRNGQETSNSPASEQHSHNSTITWRMQEVKEPMSQPCQTVAVHSNTVFYPVRGSIDPSFVFSGAWIENGRMKTTLEGGWAYDPPLPGYDGDLIEGEPVTIPGTGTFELIGITLSCWGNSPETITFCFTPDPNLLDNAKKHLPPGQTLPSQDEN